MKRKFEKTSTEILKKNPLNKIFKDAKTRIKKEQQEMKNKNNIHQKKAAIKRMLKPMVSLSLSDDTK